MKPFNLEKALAGAPVQLRDGRKAKLIFKIPDELVFSGGLRPEYPLLGFIYKRNGELHHAKEYWSLDGGYMLGSDEDELDIVGLWEESLEDTIRKAYSDGLPLRTRGGEKVYIVQISESDNPLVRDLPVFGVMSDIASHRWGIEGNYLNNDKQSPHDLVGLWEEEN